MVASAYECAIGSSANLRNERRPRATVTWCGAGQSADGAASWSRECRIVWAGNTANALCYPYVFAAGALLYDVPCMAHAGMCLDREHGQPPVLRESHCCACVEFLTLELWARDPPVTRPPLVAS